MQSTVASLGRVYFQKKLSDLLSRAPDEDFLRMIWALNEMQRGNKHYARRLIDFPDEAATADRASPHAIHEWELEFLANELLTTSKAVGRSAKDRILNCRSYPAAARLVNMVRAFENAEYRERSGKFGILTEMQRIAQRQFEWQSGFFNKVQLFRHSFIVQGPLASKAFTDRHGIDVAEFCYYGFGMYSLLIDNPAFYLDLDLGNVGMDREKFGKALSILSVPILAARAQAANLRSKPWSKAYQPSLFRQTPLIRFNHSRPLVVGPLRDLLFARITSGVYYDVVGGGSEIRNEIGRRFEEYCKQLLERMLPGSRVSESHKHKAGMGIVDSPDIIIQSEAVHIIVECKSKRMRVEGRYSEDPLVDDPTGIDEIAKAVFQLWRYFAFLRLNGPEPQVRTIGLVVTLDSWYMISKEIRDAVFTRAREKAAREPTIAEVDMTEVIVTPVRHLEIALLATDEQGFLASLQAALTEQHRGWFLDTIANHIGVAKAARSYPFEADMKSVLPWFASL